MIIHTSKGTIHYESIGEGHPLVVLHALAMDHRAMKIWLEPLFEDDHGGLSGYQRIYVDLPAHGSSEITSDVCSSDQLLESLLEFIDILLPSQPFSLLGMSFGGYMAQGIMGQKQDQIDKLCLIAPVLHRKNRTLPAKVVMERDEDLLAELDADARAAFETLLVYQNRANWELFRSEVQPGRLLANRVFLASEWRTNGYFLSQEPLSEETYSQPTLLLLGRQDAICGYRDHLQLIDQFPRATCAILDQSGHMLQIEQRELVQQLVLEWLKR